MAGVPFRPAVPPRGARPKRMLRLPRHLVRGLAAAAAVVLPACDDVVGLQWARVVGKYNPGDDPEPLISSEAVAGVPQEVTVWTTGGGCTKAADTAVEYASGRLALVTPYDHVGVNANCALTGPPVEHRAKVVFNDPGTAHIVFRYSSWWASGPRRADGRQEYLVQVSPAG